MAMVSAAEASSGPDLFQINLEAFKRWAPHLYARLSAVETPNSELRVDPDGRLDMTFRGQGFYDGDAVATTAEQFDKFFADPLRHAINEPDPERLKGACGEFCRAVVGRMAEEGIGYDSGHFPPEAHMAVVFGVGLGLHVGPLIERTAARVAVLIEPNLEFLYHSLFVTDWHALFERADQARGKILIVVESESATIAAKVRQTLRANNPALLDGIYLYTHYPSVILEQAKDRIRHELFLTLAGLGFFEDELIMTRNAAANLCRGDAGILSDYHSAREERVFIVGSGPSLRNDLDFIAGHAEQAVVISIGTGLRVLLHEGIRPDFHVELENGEPTLKHISETAEAFGLEGITLIASATVHPEVTRMFGRSLLFFREVVSSTVLFARHFKILRPAGPTVANSALIAAIRLGFREIYLFGVDMGSKSAAEFHAPNTIYSTGLISEYATRSKSFAGNFGGEASGESVLNWSRNVLEGALAAHRSVRVFNCSDGVRVAGALPKVARAIELPEGPVDRAALMDSLAARLRGYPLALLHEMWDSKTRHDESRDVFDRMEGVLEQAAAEPGCGMEWIHDLFEIVRPEGEAGAVTRSYLTGTTLLLIGCASWYERRIAEAETRDRYRAIAVPVLLETLRGMRRRLTDLLDEIDGKLGAEDAGADS